MSCGVSIKQYFTLESLWSKLFVIALFFVCFWVASAFGSVLSYELHGLPEKPAMNVKHRLDILGLSMEKDGLTKLEVDRFIISGPNEIREGLTPFGYFHPKIETKVKRKHNEWIVSFHINPGPRTKITHLSLIIKGEGKNDHQIIRTVGNFPIKTNDFFDSETYVTAKDELLNAAIARGFLDSKLEKSEVLIDKKANKASVTLTLNTGRQYYFGFTKFDGSSLSNSLLMRYAPYRSDDPYKAAQIETFQQDLAQSGYFKQAWVVPEKDKAVNYKIPVDVKMRERASVHFKLGLGFGTDTGPRGSGIIMLRRLNRYGHKLSFSTRISAKHQQFVGNYTIPGRRPATERYVGSVSYVFQDYRNGESLKRSVAAHAIFEDYGWKHTWGLSLQREDSRPKKGPDIKSTLLIPSLDLLYVKKDDPIKPNYGYRIGFNFKGAKEGVLADDSFLQLRGDVKYVTLLPLSNRVVLRGSGGYTFVNSIDDLPISLQFYTGGPDSLRGFRFNQIGPGKSLVQASVQLQHDVWNNLYIGPFYDIGNASDSVFHDINEGAGVAASWLTPVGALRFSVGTPVSKHDSSIIVQFSMGPEL